MKPPLRPTDEARRLEALRQYDLLDTLPEPVLDDLTALAAHLCDAPISLISVVDDQRQWFKSRFGLAASETPRDISFCGHTILQRDLVIVRDALLDERFADNPLILGDLPVRFYAAVPLINFEGQTLGTLCVIDHVPRDLSPLQQEALRVLTRQAMAQLELRRQKRGLARSELLLRAIFDSEPECVKVLGPDGALRMMNRAGLALIEADSLAQVAGHCVYALVAPEQRAEFEALSARVFAGESGTLEFQIVGLKGTPRWLETHAAPLRDERGDVTALLGITRDITKRKQDEAATHSMSRRMRFIAQMTNAVLGNSTMAAVAQRLTVQVREAFEVDACVIRLLEENQLVLLATQGVPAKQLEPCLPVFGLAQQIMTARSPVVIADVRNDPRTKDLVEPGPGAFSFVSFAGVPLVAEGAIVGILGIYMTHTLRTFSAVDLEHLQIVANHAAVSLSNEQLFNTVQAQKHQLETVVAAREQAEVAVREERARLAGLIDSAMDAVITVDATQRITLFNPAAEKMFGYAAAAMFGQPLTRLIPVRFQAGHGEHLRAFGHTGISSRRMGGLSAVTGQRANGVEFPIEVAISQIEVSGQKFFTAILRDVTNRLQAERHIKQLNRVYTVLSDINQTIVREPNPLAMLVAACRIAVEKGQFRLAWIGLAAGPGRRLKMVAHAGATAETLERLNALLGDEMQGCRFTWQAWRTGGHAVCNDFANDPQAAAWQDLARTLDFQAMASLPLKVKDEVIGSFNLYAGEPGSFDEEEMRLLDELAMDLGYALEVNRREKKRVQAEAARDILLGLHAKLSVARAPVEVARSIFAAADQLWQVDAGTLNVYLPEPDLMQAVLNFDIIAGQRQDVRLVEIIGKPTPRLRRIMERGGELILRQPPITPHPDNVMFGDLARPSASMIHVPIRWQGRAVGILSVQSYTPNAFTEEDVHTLQGLADHCGGTLERIRADAALQDSEERLRLALMAAQQGLYDLNVQTGETVVSPEYAVMLGYDPASFRETNAAWIERLHPDDREPIAHAYRDYIAGRSAEYRVEFRQRTKTGEWKWILSLGRIVESAPDGTPWRMLGTHTDITARKQLEEQLRQSQKMEAIGQLAGGVAHDFNNILAAIMMQAELVITTEKLPPGAVEYVNEIKASAERAASLTRQLLAFSRRQVMQSRLLDLNGIVTSLVKMLQRILGEDVRLQLNLYPRELLTRADAGMLDQVLLNLVINARDAMPGGGRLIIETDEKKFTAAAAALIPDAKPGRSVCLRVTDTGTGIAPENLPRIFEPFFTTKAVGKGTGLGLATVFGIIKQHGGWLMVESEVGRGTTLQIYLPAAAAAAEAAAASAVQPKPRGGTETILLVEDELSVRRLTRVVLERAGYQVLEADDGVAALRIWEEHEATVALLLTDIVMPEGISGRELAARLQARNPRLGVIFTSGYSAEIAGRELALHAGQNFIQKPATPDHLLETVRRCLDR